MNAAGATVGNLLVRKLGKDQVSGRGFRSLVSEVGFACINYHCGAQSAHALVWHCQRAPFIGRRPRLALLFDYDHQARVGVIVGRSGGEPDAFDEFTGNS